MSHHILVIGANGGIAKELIKQYCQNQHDVTVHSVSRSEVTHTYANQFHTVFNTGVEAEIIKFLQKTTQNGIRFDKVICTTGVLHRMSTDENQSSLKPEKRLEDIQQSSLAEYFAVNTILPALWLKHLVKSVNKNRACLVFFSARVGSISENGLGGWYGYRASKAALNMIVKTASIEYKRRSANSVLACYHPGTVDTELSKPFQANVKPGKLFTAQYTAERLIAHIEKLDCEQSPYYFDWDGQNIQY